MELEQQMVRRFHEKFGFPVATPMSRIPQNADTRVIDRRMESIALELLSMEHHYQKEAIDMEDLGFDPRLYRAIALLGELAEYFRAYGARDEVKVADSLIDMMYFELGDCVVNRFPASKLFEEVHRSNMTKVRTPGDRRMRKRGDTYSPPRLGGIIAEYRKCGL